MCSTCCAARSHCSDATAMTRPEQLPVPPAPCMRTGDLTRLNRGTEISQKRVAPSSRIASYVFGATVRYDEPSMEPYFAARETLAHAEAEALAKGGRVLSAAILKALFRVAAAMP